MLKRSLLFIFAFLFQINSFSQSNFYDIDIELFQNFYNLSHVYIIVDTQKEEKVLLELKNNDEE